MKRRSWSQRRRQLIQWGPDPGIEMLKSFVGWDGDDNVVPSQSSCFAIRLKAPAILALDTIECSMLASHTGI